MTAKEFLKNYFILSEQINDSIEELSDLRAKAHGLGVIDLSKQRTQGGKLSCVISDSVIELVDLEQSIVDSINDAIQARREIEKLISKIKDPLIQTVLRKRYIHFKGFAHIIADLNRSNTTIFRLHGEGLNEIEKMVRLGVNGSRQDN